MQNNRNLRQTISAYITLFYLFPVLLFLWYSTTLKPGINAWIALPIGILLSVVGAIFLILKMCQWEGVILEEVDLLAYSKAQLLQQRSQQQQQPQTHNPISVQHDEEPPLWHPSTVEDAVYTQVELENKQLQHALHHQEKQLDELNNQLQQSQQDQEALRYQAEQIRQELFFYQQTAREQLKQKEQLLEEQGQTIYELRNSLEKSQQQVTRLEGSVADLTYEIKTLLQVSEMEHAPQPASIKSKDTPLPIPAPNPSFVIHTSVPPPPYPLEKTETSVRDFSGITTQASHTSQEASLQLKRCLDIAQKLTAATHFSMASRFRDLPLENNFALDQRRLYESLRSETASMVLLFSMKDDQLLFVNNLSKTMLGWSPERFIQDFPEIIQPSQAEWKKAINTLATQPEVHLQLTLKTKTGQDQKVLCHLGAVPSGVFKNHAIAVCFTAE